MARRRVATAAAPQKEEAALSQRQFRHPSAPEIPQPHSGASTSFTTSSAMVAPYKMLTVLDEYTREALTVTVKPKNGQCRSAGSALSASAQAWKA